MVHRPAHRDLRKGGHLTTGALMNVLVLASVAALCGLAAIWLWLQQSKGADLLKKALDRADKAEADARERADRVDALRKKAEAPREAAPKDDKALKETRAAMVVAKEEVKRLQAVLKRAEQENQDIQIKQRRAEARVEELANALAAGAYKKAPPAPEPIAAPPPAPEPRAEVPVDPAAEERAQLRRAELEAERAARIAEAEKARTEREAARAARNDDKLQEFVDKLKGDRERLKQMLFDRELVLRIERKRSEHNRRAYMMTMGALELAEDELYRIKHGRERPELIPTRAGQFEEENPQQPEVSAEELAEARQAVVIAEGEHAAELAAAEVAAEQEALQPASEPALEPPTLELAAAAVAAPVPEELAATAADVAGEPDDFAAPAPVAAVEVVEVDAESADAPALPEPTAA